MSFRQRLTLIFSLTVLLCVVAVAWIVFALARRALEQANDKSSAALVAQFHREFDRQKGEIAHRIESIAASDAVLHIAIASEAENANYGTYLNDARNIAQSQRLDFLEFVDDQGRIISSAQSPAKFGYKADSIPSAIPAQAFLQKQELSEGSALGLVAVRQVESAGKPFYVTGGRKIDKGFLAAIELPAGMRAMFYQDLGSGFQPDNLLDPSGRVQNSALLAPLIQQVQQRGAEENELIHWSRSAADDESVDAIPLTGLDHRVLGIFLVGNSQRSYVELRGHVRSAALIAAGAGLCLAILISGWVSKRVTRPVEQLAATARQVAAGNWEAQAPVTSSDELGELAESFNYMTQELLQQKERLVQTERVAAWRELARRLAHELKNPLFPLQLTVENLLRARTQNPEQFEEVLQESSSTLLAEIANLKTIISRFSEFSKMPHPHFENVQVNDLVQNAVRLFQAQLQMPGNPEIACKLELSTLPPLPADPDVLHRALSNLILNAMDAMPEGGVLGIRTRPANSGVSIEISDTGGGITPEECERLFTPYYTTKAHGTGLGLAVVQSIISDHGGRIYAHSQPGAGTTFTIELPLHRQGSETEPATGDATAV